MTTENPTTTTQGTPEPTAAGGEILSTMVDTEQEQSAEFGDADREKMTEVVRKERAAARAAAARAENAERRLAELEAAELRRTVAEEKGLTPEQAAFLTGDTAEEMAAGADALLAAFPAVGRRPGPFEVQRTGATGDTEPAESMESIANRVLD
jgi:hypothetical protein